MKRKDEFKPAEDLMTLREAHEAFSKVSYVTIWKWARDGYLPTIRIGGKTFILRDRFMQLLSDPGRRPAA
jgi:hypothetical protein